MHFPLFLGVDTMEKGALVGMMALACSDLLFCLVTLSGAHLQATKMIYDQRNFDFYYALYSNSAQNILIKTSSWFTVILSLGRYFVVCHPFQARKYLKCKHTMVAILLSTIIWILLFVPSISYTWTVYNIDCVVKPIHVLVSGQFSNNENFRMIFTNIWFTLGFAVPVVLLGYCNTKLIISLQLSKRFETNGNRHRGLIQRSQYYCMAVRGDRSNQRRPIVIRSSFRSAQPQVNMRISNFRDYNQRKITYTLIAIVICFFTFTLPSEIAQFYFEMKKPHDNGAFGTVLNVVNLMQVVNFSCNFVLYCAVNAYFRKTIRNFLQIFSKTYYQEINTDNYNKRRTASVNTSGTEV